MQELCKSFPCNLKKPILVFFFIFFITNSIVFGWIGGGGDATCNTISCNLSDDDGYSFTALDFTGTAGFSDGIDNSAAIDTNEFVNASWTNITYDLELDNDTIIRWWNTSWFTGSLINNCSGGNCDIGWGNLTSVPADLLDGDDVGSGSENCSVDQSCDNVIYTTDQLGNTTLQIRNQFNGSQNISMTDGIISFNMSCVDWLGAGLCDGTDDTSSIDTNALDIVNQTMLDNDTIIRWWNTSWFTGSLINNCSVDGSCADITYDNELEYINNCSADQSCDNIIYTTDQLGNTTLQIRNQFNGSGNISMTDGIISFNMSCVEWLGAGLCDGTDDTSAVDTNALDIVNHTQLDNATIIRNHNTSWINETGDNRYLKLIQDNWYNDPNDWINWNNVEARLEFNESKLSSIYYNATKSYAIAGTIDAGTLANTQHPDGSYDGITLNFTEASGSPGLDLRINFTNVSDFNQGVMRYYTNSLAGEFPIIQMWNYDDSIWEDYPPVGESETFATITQPVFDSSDHLQDEVAQMRIYKASNGNTNNHYYVDWIAVIKGYGTPSGEEIDPHFEEWLNNPILEYELNASEGILGYNKTVNLDQRYCTNNSNITCSLIDGKAVFGYNGTVGAGSSFDPSPLDIVNQTMLDNDTIIRWWNTSWFTGSLINNCSADGSCGDITYDNELEYVNNCSVDGSCDDVAYDTELIGNCSADQSCDNIIYTTDQLGNTTLQIRNQFNGSQNISIADGIISFNMSCVEWLGEGICDGTDDTSSIDTNALDIVNQTMLDNDTIIRWWNTSWFTGSLINNCSVDASCDAVTYDNELEYVNNCSVDGSCDDVAYDTELIGNCTADQSCDNIIYTTDKLGNTTLQIRNQFNGSQNISIADGIISFNMSCEDWLGVGICDGTDDTSSIDTNALDIVNQTMLDNDTIIRWWNTSWFTGSLINNCSVDGSCGDITYDNELEYVNNCSVDGSCDDVAYDTELIGNCSADQSCDNIIYTTDQLGNTTLQIRNQFNGSQNISIADGIISFNMSCEDWLGAGLCDGTDDTSSIDTNALDIVNQTMLDNDTIIRWWNTSWFTGSLINNCSADGSCGDITYDNELEYVNNCSVDGSCDDVAYDTELIGNCSADQSCDNIIYTTDQLGNTTLQIRNQFNGSQNISIADGIISFNMSCEDWLGAGLCDGTDDTSSIDTNALDIVNQTMLDNNTIIRWWNTSWIYSAPHTNRTDTEINSLIDARVIEAFLTTILDSVYASLNSLLDLDVVNTTMLDNDTIIRQWNTTWVTDKLIGNCSTEYGCTDIVYQGNTSWVGYAIVNNTILRNHSDSNFTMASANYFRFNNDTTHSLESNTTCVIIKGDTSELHIC